MNQRLAVLVLGSLATLGTASAAQAQPATPTQPAAPAATPAPQGTPASPAAAPAAAPAGQAADPARAARGEHDEEEEVRKAHNAIFLELGGNGLIYSVNYERLFGDSNASLRVGFSYISVGASSGGTSASATLMTFPVLGNYYLGSQNHKLHLGAGLTFMQISAQTGGKSSLVSASGFVPAPTVVIGYRYIPAKGGFAFSVGFTPFIIPGGDKPIFPWAGISFGGIF